MEKNGVKKRGFDLKNGKDGVKKGVLTSKMEKWNKKVSKIFLVEMLFLLFCFEKQKKGKKWAEMFFCRYRGRYQKYGLVTLGIAPSGRKKAICLVHRAYLTLQNDIKNVFP